MFCKNCGAQLPDTVKFCNACGTQVTPPTQAAPAAPAAPAAAPTAAATEAAYEAYLQQQAAPAPAQPTYTPPQEPQVRDYTNMTIDDVAAQPQGPAYDYTNGMPAAPKKENVALGLIGSIIGVLVGSVAYFGLGINGVVSGLSGLIMVALGLFLYHKLSGAEHSVTGAIITTVLAAIAVFFAEWFVCGYVLYDEKLVTSFGDGVSNWFTIIERYPELEEAYVHDLVMGYLFTAIGAVASIAKEIQASKKSK